MRYVDQRRRPVILAEFRGGVVTKVRGDVNVGSAAPDLVQQEVPCACEDGHSPYRLVQIP